MTDRLISTSMDLRADGEELRSEIDRHGSAFYERLCRMESRLQQELLAIQSLKRRFEWAVPQDNAAANKGLGSMTGGANLERRAIGVVSTTGSQGGSGGRTDGRDDR